MYNTKTIEYSCPDARGLTLTQTYSIWPVQNRSIFGEIRGSSYYPNLLFVKRIFEHVKDLFLGSTLQKCLAFPFKFVILMAQRSSANVAGLRVRAKFTRILSDSVKCCLLLGNEDAVGLKADSGL